MGWKTNLALMKMASEEEIAREQAEAELRKTRLAGNMAKEQLQIRGQQESGQQKDRFGHDLDVLGKTQYFTAGESDKQRGFVGSQNVYDKNWQSAEKDKELQAHKDLEMNRLLVDREKMTAGQSNKEYEASYKRAHDLWKGTPEYIDDPKIPGQKVANPHYKAAYENFMRFQPEVPTAKSEESSFIKGAVGTGNTQDSAVSRKPGKETVVTGPETLRAPLSLHGGTGQGGGEAPTAGPIQRSIVQTAPASYPSATGGQQQDGTTQDVPTRTVYSQKMVRNGNSYGIVVEPQSAGGDEPYYGKHQVSTREVPRGNVPLVPETRQQVSAHAPAEVLPADTVQGVDYQPGPGDMNRIVTIPADKKKIRPEASNFMNDPNHWIAQPLSSGKFYSGAAETVADVEGEYLRGLGNVASFVPRKIYQAGSRVASDAKRQSDMRRLTIQNDSKRREDEREWRKRG